MKVDKQENLIKIGSFCLVLIPQGYRIVGYEDINETNLVIPAVLDGKAIVEIGESAFSNCVQLTRVVIPNTVTKIAGVAFEKCVNLSTVKLSSGLTSIGFWAFFDCENLTEITIPNRVKMIDIGAFRGCCRLERIIVEEGNEAYQSIDGDLYTKDGKILLQYAPAKKATSFTVPNGVTTIVSGAFCKANYLENLEIPNGLTTIDSQAFLFCTSLKNISMPDSIESVRRAFTNCKKVRYTIKNGLKYLGNQSNPYAYLAGVTTKKVQRAEIEKGCKLIDEYAFANCKKLQSVVIPGSVKRIGHSAFSDCVALTDLLIGNGVEELGEAAFQVCTSLQNVVIPSGVKIIRQRVFEACSGLQSVTIPDSVTSIGWDVFWGCEKLKYTEKNGLKYLGNAENPYLFFNGVTTTELVAARIENGCKIIGDYAFENCKNLTSVFIPKSVKNINMNAFNRCGEVMIYCEANGQGDWDEYWNEDNRPVHYYSERQPTKSGNYWRYVNGEIVVW